jgi:SAM-dependent methyltransferase
MRRSQTWPGRIPKCFDKEVMMNQQATDADYLRYQYADAEKLRIRQEAHRLYSEETEPLATWLLPLLAPAAGQLLLDVGCGPGMYHAELARRGVQVIGLDASYGMLVKARQRTAGFRTQTLAVQADAEHLPLPAACCERLMANHMLYHVPDQLAALGEMRRVLKPGGRATITTNMADSYAALYELHADAARGLGYEPLYTVNDAFNSNHLDRVQSVFPDAELHVRHDAFLFPDTDAVLRFYASMMIDALADRPADNHHRQVLLPAMREQVAAVIRREGVLRVPKGVACFVVRKSEN